MNKKASRIFIVPGMPRAGTTFLYYKFNEHPSIFVPSRKESHFFSTNYEKGPDWYLSLYGDMKNEKAAADISTSYFLHDKAIERIKGFNPGAKVILGVRDPVDFSLSFYKMFLSHLYGVPPFQDFISHFDYHLGGEKIPITLKDDFVTRRIEEYRKAFGENLLIFDYGLFKRDPLEVLQAIESFLGLSNHFKRENFENIVVNVRDRNIRFLNYILSRESFISVLTALFPRSWLIALRKNFDKAGKNKKASEGRNYRAEDIELAEKVFSRESAVIKEMFSTSGLLLGTGKPFGAKKISGV